MSFFRVSTSGATDSEAGAKGIDCGDGLLYVLWFRWK